MAGHKYEAKKQQVRLQVEVDYSKYDELPTVYTNYIEVRGNQEEAYIIPCLRNDPMVKLGEGDQSEDGIIRVPVKASPQLILIMSATHARRFAKALLKQTSDDDDDDDEDEE